MVSNRMVSVMSKAGRCPHDHAAPRRGAASWNVVVIAGILFAASLLVPLMAGSAAGAQTSPHFSATLDRDGNGLDDSLDAWLAGSKSWQDLRSVAGHGRNPAGHVPEVAGSGGDKILPAAGPWSEGLVRLICLGADKGAVAGAMARAAKAGRFHRIHDLDHFGGVQVVGLDAPALREFLDRPPERPGHAGPGRPSSPGGQPVPGGRRPGGRRELATGRRLVRHGGHPGFGVRHGPRRPGGFCRGQRRRPRPGRG